ncbi:MAG: IclR family transcriptional regulator [Comamonadaceae bacterium]|nr:MAG: IclR family transcriptional regulator [Comamonadaceae bacterium]
MKLDLKKRTVRTKRAGQGADDRAADRTEDKGEVSALARGLALLQAVAGAGGMSMKDLSAATDIPKPTVSRLVATLVSTGFLRQDEGSALCRLGPAFLAMGNAFLSDQDVREMLRPHLATVANVAGAKVNLGVRNGLDIMVIDSVRPRDAVILSTMEIGSRMSLATSAGGRSYLASLDAEPRQALLEELRAMLGSSWRSTAARLEDAFAEYRALGYCTSFGEWHPEINAIGMTLQGSHGQRYAVSCGGPIYKTTPDLLRQQVAPVMLRELKGWTPTPPSI